MQVCSNSAIVQLLHVRQLHVSPGSNCGQCNLCKNKVLHEIVFLEIFSHLLCLLEVNSALKSNQKQIDKNCGRIEVNAV